MRGLGLCKAFVVRDPLTGGSQRLSRGRVGRAGSGWVPPGGGGSEPDHPASTGDITDHPPPPRPPPLSSSPLFLSSLLPSSPRLLSQRGSALPRPSPPIYEGGDSPSVTSLSRFLGLRVGSSPGRGRERREELSASQALTDNHTCHRYTRCHS